MRYVRAAIAVALAVALAVPMGAALGGSASAQGRVPGRQLATARVFYVDPLQGDDAASGRSTLTPLRTLDQVARLDLQPGDRVRLRRGVVHRGALTAWQSGASGRPIVVEAYGTGGRPVVQGGGCVQVSGDHWRITAVLARDCAFSGFEVRGDNVELRDVEATGNITGVTIDSTSANAVVRSSHLHGNTRMAPNTPGSDDDYGASGVTVSGTNALIADNVFEGHRALSTDYGFDGAAVEVYAATGTRVQRNVARDNLAFIELGHSTTTGTRINYNSVTSIHPSSSFLTTRGASTFGPVFDTVATHNTVRLTAPGSIGVSCHPNCTSSILKVGSNVIQAHDVGYAEAPDGSLASISIGYNVYEDLAGDGWYGLRAARTDVRAAVSFDLTGGIPRLAAGSPAVDIGGASWPTDIQYAPAPSDGNGDGRSAADAGAYERQVNGG